MTCTAGSILILCCLSPLPSPSLNASWKRAGQDVGPRSQVLPALCRSSRGGSDVPSQAVLAGLFPMGFLLPLTPLVNPFNVGNITVARQDTPQQPGFSRHHVPEAQDRILFIYFTFVPKFSSKKPETLFWGHQIPLPRSLLR